MNDKDMIEFLQKNNLKFKRKRFYEPVDFEGKTFYYFRDEFYIETSEAKKTSEELRQGLDISELHTIDGCLQGYYGKSRANSVCINFIEKKPSFIQKYLQTA